MPLKSPFVKTTNYPHGQLPAGSSLARTDAVARRASEMILKHPGEQDTVAIVGLNGATFTNATNAAAIFVPMKPFKWRAEQGLSAGRILSELQGKLFQIKEANIFIIKPPPEGINKGEQPPQVPGHAWNSMAAVGDA